MGCHGAKEKTQTCFVETLNGVLPIKCWTSVMKTLRAPVGISVPIVGLVMGKNNATQRPSNCMVNHSVEYICQ